MNLNEESKLKLERQVLKISENDVSEVQAKILTELQNLKNKAIKKSSSKLEKLIDNSYILYEILSDAAFPISSTSKKWIVFGLRYLVSDIDLIPDGIPGIGYNDDLMIVKWVKSVIEDDVTRFEAYKHVKKLSETNSITQRMVEGSKEHTLIIIPGLIGNYEDDELVAKWTKNLGDLPPFKNVNIHIFQHSFMHLAELSKTIKVIDHDLKLKPIYNQEAFQLDWEQAGIECRLLGKALMREMQSKPKHSYSIVCFDLGSRIISAALSYGSHLNIEKLYILGGTNYLNSDESKFLDLPDKTYNFYSTSDYALKFIFDCVEKDHQPIGMSPLRFNNMKSVENINVSSEIKNHFEYKYNMHLLIDKCD